jgi:hypothetical protein
MTMADISPILSIVSLRDTRDSPSKNIKPPIANGPIIIPAKSSPRTTGNFIRWKISANSFAVKSNAASEIIT